MMEASVEYTDMAKNQKVNLPTFTNKDRKIPTISIGGLVTLNDKKAAKDAFTFVIQPIDENGKAIGQPIEI